MLLFAIYETPASCSQVEVAVLIPTIELFSAIKFKKYEIIRGFDFEIPRKQ